MRHQQKEPVVGSISNLTGGLLSTGIISVILLVAALNCHHAHTLDADCTRCHQGLNTEEGAAARGHIASMAKVACVACHSNDPVLTSVGWDNAEEKNVFTVGSGAPFTAGNIYGISRTAKQCVDCHYIGNPWGLSVH